MARLLLVIKVCSKVLYGVGRLLSGVLLALYSVFILTGYLPSTVAEKANFKATFSFSGEAYDTQRTFMALLMLAGGLMMTSSSREGQLWGGRFATFSLFWMFLIRIGPLIFKGVNPGEVFYTSNTVAVVLRYIAMTGVVLGIYANGKAGVPDFKAIAGRPSAFM